MTTPYGLHDVCIVIMSKNDNWQRNLKFETGDETKNG